MKTNLPVSGVENDYPVDDIIISVTDKHGTIKQVNTTFEKISGYRKDECIGQAHNLVRHPDMPEAAFADLWGTLQKGEAWLGIVNNRAKNGDHYWVEAFVAPTYENGEIAGYQSVRFKPNKAVVNRADSLYKQINAGKTNARTFKSIGFANRILLATLGCLLPTFIAFELAYLDMIPKMAAWGGAVISVVLAFVFTQMLSKPLKELAKETESIHNNPIANKVIGGSNDEVGQIRTALAMQAAKLKTIVGRTEDASDELAHTASELSSAAEATNGSLNQQRNEIDQLAAAIEEMSASVTEVAQNTTEAADSAQAARGTTDRIHGVANDTIQGINNLKSEVNQASEVIHSLATESNNIGQVLDVIRGIAEQTNLLALNAAIEAARAGEAGRGFAVVADEVRSLANRTAESTEEINAMIEGLQRKAASAVDAMEKAENGAKDGVEQVNNTAELLSEIASAVNTISDMSTQIATAAEEQSATSQEISRNVNSISREVENAAAQAEQTSCSSGELEHMASNLQNVVKQINV
jgi:aerotaxis receptor